MIGWAWALVRWYLMGASVFFFVELVVLALDACGLSPLYLQREPGAPWWREPIELARMAVVWPKTVLDIARGYFE